MAVKVRYRFDLSADTTVENRYRWMFGTLTPKRGTYHQTIDVNQIDKERDINELVRLSRGVLAAKIERTFMDEL
jgi:hypothetical protein